MNGGYGILSGNRILEEIEKGNIRIDPFDIKCLNPNSYNVHLAPDLLVYDHALLDMKKEEPYGIEYIPAEGKLLIPGKLYLGRTVERTFTNNFVPGIEGRSSVGRLGISVHSTAGFGDVGFEGFWTFEISCIQPVMIYSGVAIAQVYYQTIADSENEEGERGVPITYAHGKYQNNNGVQPSMLWKDFLKHD